MEILLRSKRVKEFDIQQILNLLLALSDNPESYLNKGSLEEINFYDPRLLKTISKAFYKMSYFKNLEVEKGAKQFPDLSSKFNTSQALAENHYNLEEYDLAEKLVSNDNTDKGRLIAAKIAIGKGNKKEAKRILKSLDGSKSASILRETGYYFHKSGISSRAGLKLVAESLRKSKKSVGYRRYGEMLYQLGKFQNALDNFAKGYKIQYRNDIEQNAPIYMIEYAKAIFKISKMRYEEVTETLFHIQKAFPACRQMYYYMQGIAAEEVKHSVPSEGFMRKAN